ncbi:MAG: lysophospholipid acyltransferase family protein [Rhizomicrobium sp.]|nr:lysophospholipid acyltransferase family protein [Rhizomicrobium sp.]
MTVLRSLLFFVYFTVVSVVLHIVALPTLLLPRLTVVRISQAWSRAIFWGLKWIAGCGFEVRGEIPQGAVLVAAKHMSMWDTLALYMLLDDVCVVVKRELLSIPFYGWYIKRSGVIAIDRAAGASALRQMAKQAAQMVAAGRPIAIFPEGTRVKPGTPPDYKPGVAGLYALTGIACVPVALNSGQFWQGFLKRRGTIVIAFLPPIPAGLKRAAFMAELEARIETASNGLLAEGAAQLGAEHS